MDISDRLRDVMESLSPADSIDDWGLGSSWTPRLLRDSLGSTDPLSLADLNVFGNGSRLKAPNSAWSFAGDFPSLRRQSRISTSPLSTHSKPHFEDPISDHNSARLRKDDLSGGGGGAGVRYEDPSELGRPAWWPTSRRAPDGAPRLAVPPEGRTAELRTELEKSAQRRAELLGKLRVAQRRLDNQTDALKARDSELQQSLGTTQRLEHKQRELAEALRALEDQKDVDELSRFEERHRRGELQDKVLQLELDMLKLKSTLAGTHTEATPLMPTSTLSRTLPVTQQDFQKEGQLEVEKELGKLRDALKEAEQRAEQLEHEHEHTLQKLHKAKEAQMSALTQAEDLNQRLGRASRSQADLEEHLSDARSRLGQLELERGLMASKAQRVEDSMEDLRARLAATLSDKDRLVQEKAELHQRAQGLQLQLERAERGREGYTDQVCELHTELSNARTSTTQHQRQCLVMEEELSAAKQLSEKLTCDLEMARQKVEVTLGQTHQLEAERVIQTNQIAALEAERMQLIGEKEELLSSAHSQGQEVTRDEDLEVMKELRQRLLTLSESHDAMQQKREELEALHQSLRQQVSAQEAELQRQAAERQRLEAGFSTEREELKRVANHWNGRWEEVAMKLRLTQGDLEEGRRLHGEETNKLREEATQLSQTVRNLQSELQRSQDHLRHLEEQKTQCEATVETLKVKSHIGAQLEAEMDSLRQQLQEERLRNQRQQQEHADSQVCVAQVDSELGQVRAELQEVWDMLRLRDSALEEQQQELQSARSQASQHSGEVEKLEQRLADMEQALTNRENALSCVERQRETEREEAHSTIRTLQLKLAELERSSARGRESGRDSAACLESLTVQLEESRMRAEQLQQERDQAVQKLRSLKDVLQNKPEKGPPSEVHRDPKPSPPPPDHDQHQHTHGHGHLKTTPPGLVQQHTHGHGHPKTTLPGPDQDPQPQPEAQAQVQVQPQPQNQARREKLPDKLGPAAQEQQRRLVTEQLKSLFKEREQLGGQMGERSPITHRRAGSPQRAKVIKGPLERRLERELLVHTDQQQGAADTLNTNTQCGAQDPQGKPCAIEDPLSSPKLPQEPPLKVRIHEVSVEDVRGSVVGYHENTMTTIPASSEERRREEEEEDSRSSSYPLVLAKQMCVSDTEEEEEVQEEEEEEEEEDRDMGEDNN